MHKYEGQLQGLAFGRLVDKVAIISGAGRGIGRTTAIGFARLGSRLTLLDMDEPA